MVRTVLRTQSDLDALIDAVDATDEPIVVEDQGKRRLVVMSPEEFDRLRDDQAERDWQTIQRLQERNADKDPDEVLRVVTAVVEDVRRERYERQRRDPGSR
jgi:PHD/YefM family antitoxin component YafN of YafNO toxin-antitoxin module